MTPPATAATIAELPFFVAGRFPKPDLVGRAAGGTVESQSGREFADRIRDLSLGLSALGMRQGDHVALLSESRPEWLLADFAILTAGAVTIPIYPTVSIEQVRFILTDSRTTIAVVSSPAQLEKVLEARAPLLRTVVLIDGASDRAGDGSVRVRSMASVAAEGHQAIVSGWGVAREFQDRVRAVRPADLATIIYTSGTTAAPKGVMLSHGNLAANVAGVLQVLDLNESDTALSFLPLCHAFERTVAYVCLSSGVSLVFAESIDTIARDLLVVRPTVMSAVPRVFEKLHGRILEKGHQATGVRRRVFDWAMSVAERRGAHLTLGQPVPWTLRVASSVADRQVFSRIRDGIGGRLRWAVSGSAPLNRRIAAFFAGAGLPILEGYGLTETAPVLTVTPPGGIRLGTVGPPLPNVELRIADDGEVLARGPNVMQGYFGRPEESAAALVNGWFHTGDIGALDEHGYLTITDRKKELLVTSGGKKIAPQPIEERFRADPLVNEAMLVGDRRHFPALLIAPDFRALARHLQVDEPDVRADLDSPEVRALYQKIVDGVNLDLAQFERIKKFALVADEFSVASGELTPTLKIKRRVLLDKYADVIEAFYLNPTHRTIGPS
jgi:long-chain acyl-CoA synthetase